MGYLTTITIKNDALHTFEENPKEFAEAIFKGIDEANRNYKSASVGFKGYCNYIDVRPSRHADDHTVYVHAGNDVLNINPYNKDMADLIRKSPEIATEYIKRAERIIKEAKNILKPRKKKAK